MVTFFDPDRHETGLSNHSDELGAVPARHMKHPPVLRLCGNCAFALAKNDTFHTESSNKSTTSGKLCWQSTRRQGAPCLQFPVFFLKKKSSRLTVQAQRPSRSSSSLPCGRLLLCIVRILHGKSVSCWAQDELENEQRWTPKKQLKTFAQLKKRN